MILSTPITVLGAGSWGTALAIQLARNNQTVYLWGHKAADMAAMQMQRCNEKYLPAIVFPEKLHTGSDLAVALKNTRDILIAVPSHAFQITLDAIQPWLTTNSRIAWATKGLDPQSHQLLHIAVEKTLGRLPMAVLSGPTFAQEVARGLPTALTVASQATDFTHDLIARLHSKNFRVYSSSDIIGVELGGAMKNVLAIAVGIADGLGLGANARAALITRGLAEIMRLGAALGAQRDTFMGLAGLGDLLLTCTDDQSRNRRFGLAIGRGNSRENAEQEIGQVVEGIATAQEIYYLARQHTIEAPISEQIYRVLYENITPAAAVNKLLAREPRAEKI
jgi:glycerol-3-phosphate dehydrogenase (NAD(P)+)